MNECWCSGLWEVKATRSPELWRRFKDEWTDKHCLSNNVTNELWVSLWVWLSTFYKLVQCPFGTRLFGTGRLFGLRHCCLQLSWEPLIQTASHWTLRFLQSSAIHPPSVKSIRWDRHTYIQTDRDSFHFSQISFIDVKVSLNKIVWFLFPSCVFCIGRSVLLWAGSCSLSSVLLWYCCLQLSRGLLIQTTSHSTLHFLGSSETHPPSVKLSGWMVIEKYQDRQRLLWLLYVAAMHLHDCHIEKVKIRW